MTCELVSTLNSQLHIPYSIGLATKATAASFQLSERPESPVFVFSKDSAAVMRFGMFGLRKVVSMRHK